MDAMSIPPRINIVGIGYSVRDGTAIPRGGPGLLLHLDRHHGVLGDRGLPGPHKGRGYSPVFPRKEQDRCSE